MKTLLEYNDFITFKSYIKESSDHMFDDDPGVDFDERWEKLDNEDEAYKYLESKLPEYKGDRKPGIMDIYKSESESGPYYIAYLHGGENGPGSWVEYCEYLTDLFTSVPGSWVIDLINDCADDVWTLRLGYEIKETSK